ncbi:hypothetical protein WG906_01700 [Pedobacter sp. P351]|uniref:hypothetical protein n=1 Tax=Pedobacter superstes TaxID=3133441 RepID=UPI0030AC8343
MRNFLRALGLGILLGVMPVIVSANDEIVLNFSSPDEIDIVGSAPVETTQDDKDQEPKKKTDKEKAKEDPKTDDVETKKPDIKEVPKSRPKLRPGVVTDRVKIKRPPVKINKPGRVLRTIGL